MAPNWKVTTLLASTALAASAALARPCVGFDSDFNLYVFGGSTDYFLGPQSGWFNPSTSFPFQRSASARVDQIPMTDDGLTFSWHRPKRSGVDDHRASVCVHIL